MSLTFSNPRPTQGDTRQIAALKLNARLAKDFADLVAATPKPYPGGFMSLAPTRTDSLPVTLKKINALIELQFGPYP